MRGGGLRHELRIQRKVQVGVTALNEPNFVWQTWRTALAELEVRRGKEHFDVASKQRYGEDVYIFRVRYEEVTGIETSMQVLDEYDSAYDIRSVRPDKQRRSDCQIECTLQDGVLESADLSISIKDAIPIGAVGVAYGGFTISAAGGTAPYSFSAESGSLPSGLSLNPTTGAVTGTPTSAGAFVQDILVTDADGTVAALPEFTITVT